MNCENSPAYFGPTNSEGFRRAEDARRFLRQACPGPLREPAARFLLSVAAERVPIATRTLWLLLEKFPGASLESLPEPPLQQLAGVFRIYYMPDAQTSAILRDFWAFARQVEKTGAAEAEVSMKI